MRHLFTLLLSICTIQLHAERVTLNWNKDTISVERSYHPIDTIDAVIRQKFADEVFIKSSFSCNSSTFSNGVSFSCAIFSKQVDFWGTTFLNKSNFSLAIFSEKVEFSKAVFKEGEFSNAKFSEASFYAAKFSEKANFSEATFSKEINFSSAIFPQKANFSRTTFLKRCIFSYAVFGSTADFRGTISDSTIFDFTGCYLSDTLDFSYNERIKNEVNLQFCNFVPDSVHAGRTLKSAWLHYFRPNYFDTAGKRFRYINLFNSDIKGFRIDYLHFRLQFFNNSNPEWHNEGGGDSLSDDQKSVIYESLLKNFRDRGQTESIKALDIEYQYFRHNHSFWAYLQDWWWRFGYEKWRIFPHIALFLFLFTILTIPIVHRLHENVYELEAITKKEENTKDGHWRIGKRLWYAIIYTFIVFFAFSLKIDKLRLKSGFYNILGTFYVLFVSAVGLLCLGYLVNFVLQK